MMLFHVAIVISQSICLTSALPALPTLRELSAPTNQLTPHSLPTLPALSTLSAPLAQQSGHVRTEEKSKQDIWASYTKSALGVWDAVVLYLG
jgi:hypothetical protein